MGEVNRLLGQLSKTGFVHETVLLGEIIHQRYYAPRPGGNDSGQLVQAALWLKTINLQHSIGSRCPGGVLGSWTWW